MYVVLVHIGVSRKQGAVGKQGRFGRQVGHTWQAGKAHLASMQGALDSSVGKIVCKAVLGNAQGWSGKETQVARKSWVLGTLPWLSL